MSTYGSGINIGAAFGVNIPIDYTSRDYQSLLSDMQGLVPTFLPEWSASSEFDFGVILLELFAYVGDIDNYYIDRIANESFLTTAQQRSSVINIAALMDYAPADAASAIATMTLALPANQPAQTLPIYSQFATQATATTPSIIFETLQTYILPATTTAVSISSDLGGNTIKVYQGVAVVNEQLGTSNGTATQSFTLVNTGVVGGSVVVSVNEGAGFVTWAEVASLIDAGPYDAVYVISTDANGVVYVGFGDGNNGSIPTPQSPIEATYIVGGGSIGNVGANQITVDMTGTTFFTSVTNATAAVGGSDPETIAQIQANAPASLTAADRCVSLQDYATVAMQLPGVSQANATAAVPTSITLYVHPAGGPYKVADLSTMVGNLTTPPSGLTWALTNVTKTGYLDTRKMAGTSITVLPPIYDGSVGYMPIILTITLVVLPQYSQLVVVQSVQAAITTLFNFLTMGFGPLLTRSSVYAAVNQVPGVSYLIVTTMCRGDSTGLTDIICGPSEIPVLIIPDTGANGLTINASGGL